MDDTLPPCDCIKTSVKLVYVLGLRSCSSWNTIALSAFNRIPEPMIIVDPILLSRVSTIAYVELFTNVAQQVQVDK